MAEQFYYFAVNKDRCDPGHIRWGPFKSYRMMEQSMQETRKITGEHSRLFWMHCVSNDVELRAALKDLLAICEFDLDTMKSEAVKALKAALKVIRKRPSRPKIEIYGDPDPNTWYGEDDDDYY